METLREVWQQLWAVLSYPLFNVGATQVSLWKLLYFAILLVLLVYGTNRMRLWLAERVLARRGVEVGVRQALGSLVRYGALFVGLLIIFQALGVDLSALAILAGALGVGVGFGLQAITSNFVSGLIILFERPIKVGDRVEVGDIVGDVANISARATTVITNQNIAVIVPNAEFITSRVINWSYTDRDVRLDLPVGVAYGSDLREVKRVLLAVAGEHPGVLDAPKPDVLLSEFGESSLNLSLRVWTRDYTTRPGVLRSELNFAIVERFREHKIEIPFPQRDLHFRTGALPAPAPARG